MSALSTHAVASNRILWDALVGQHVQSAFYDLRGFLEGGDPLGPLEDTALGPVDGCSVLHLMCHFGLDSLALARRGAHVTGLDFSARGIDVARRIAEREGLDATFVQAEVTTAAEALDGERFDRVFTSWGVTIWLPDLGAWARNIAQCLRPGGTFHLLEVHPMAWVFLDPADPDRICNEPQQPYATHGVPLVEDVAQSYAAPTGDTALGTQHLWHHPIADVVTALIEAGLVLERLVERDTVTTQVLPALVQRDDGLWGWPEGAVSLPLSYEVRAGLPTAG